jgi:hypothetical protein
MPELVFTPAARVAYKAGDQLAFALEHYDFGPHPSQSRFAVFDYRSSGQGIEFGIGRGLTRATDSWVLKLMLMRNL